MSALRRYPQGEVQLYLPFANFLFHSFHQSAVIVESNHQILTDLSNLKDQWYASVSQTVKNAIFFRHTISWKAWKIGVWLEFHDLSRHACATVYFHTGCELALVFQQLLENCPKGCLSYFDALADWKRLKSNCPTIGSVNTKWKLLKEVMQSGHIEIS